MVQAKKKKTTAKRKKKTQPSHLLRLLRYCQIFAGSVLVFISISAVYALFFPPIPFDDRPGRIDAYFEKHNAPIAGHGETFVQAADSCGMDWRLLPAIAMRESTGGKRMQLNNPFGWGSARIPFTSINDAIRGVGKNLCGHRTSTAKWYSTTSTYKKLYYYNGSVLPSYPAEVMWIMDQI